jgi:hypothetical protein
MRFSKNVEVFHPNSARPMIRHCPNDVVYLTAVDSTNGQNGRFRAPDSGSPAFEALK